MKDMIFNSVKETQQFASDYAKEISKGKVIALIGDLGSGKTTFSQGFARGLGIKDKVISPTFKLVSEYEGDKTLYHIDCYRMESAKDFINIGGEEFILSNESITLIEWADRVKPLWSEDWICIYFNIIENQPNSRIIKISNVKK